MKISEEKGFTLIEVIVVAGIIAILAGILVPMIFKEIDEARITRASADVRSISSAMIVFRKDTGQWPVMDQSNCTATATIMFGNGTQPGDLNAMGYDLSVPQLFNDHLSMDTNACYNNWKGPYIAIVSPDPWGNAYVTNTNSFAISGSPVWIISAGPNGLMETPSNALELAVDDVGVRLK